MAGSWTGNWCFDDGCKEGNDIGFRNCHDLHVGWWILCEGKRGREMHFNFSKMRSLVSINLQGNFSSIKTTLNTVI